MKLTAGTQDKKKIVILVGLLVVAAIVFYINSSAGPDSGPDPAAAAAGPRPTVPLLAPKRAENAAESAVRPRTSPSQRQLSEFRPSLKARKPEERPDPMSIDPSLRTDLLARLQTVNVEGVHRNMFDFGAPPPPKPDPQAAKKPPVPSPLLAEQQAQLNGQPQTPPQPPPPPKVPLKFYGFMSAQNQGAKRAFFLEGEDIHVVGEGDVVKKRYKIVRIGVNSVIVEDLDFKNQQTLPLEEAPAG